MTSYGAKWGFAMIHQSAIPQNAALAIQAVFASSPNHLREVDESLDSLIEEARIGHDIEQRWPHTKQGPGLRALEGKLRLGHGRTSRVPEISAAA